MRYSIYYSPIHKDHIVWYPKYSYVSNYILHSFDQISKRYKKCHRLKGDLNFWYKHENNSPITFEWIISTYPDAVLLCETNSLLDLTTQFPELCI